MKRFGLLCIVMIVLGLCCQSCSHNPLTMVFGKQAKIGNLEYGELSYLNGLAIVDVSRENSSWTIEVDDEAGLSYDAETKTLKGIKKIERRIGKQVTGYLNELADKNADSVKYVVEYLKEEPSKEDKNNSGNAESATKEGK